MSRIHRILAVDDDASNLDIIEELLAGEFQVSTASSGEGALSQASRFRPDVLLLDIMMPGLDGYQVCERLRVDPEQRFCKIVLVSGKSSLEERLRGYEVGADDYITKPFDHEELLARVRVLTRMKFIEEMDRLKTDFLTLLGHETRTPLTEILGAAEMLLSEEEMKRTSRREMASIVNRAGMRLKGMIEQGCLLFSLRSGVVPLGSKRLDLGTVLEETLEAKKVEARRRGLNLQVQPPPRTAVTGDPGFIRMALDLLVGKVLNAAEGGTVGFDLQERDGEARLRIRSRGMQGTGELNMLFEPFWVESVRHHSGAVCLDLPLAREIFLWHGGDVSLAPVAPPEGESEILVRLPAA